MRRKTMTACVVLALAGLAAAAAAQEKDAIAEYRAMFGDDNPAVFWEMRGEDLWKTARGPKNADLSACDLGLGRGVIENAYAHLPRYFSDTGQVQDLESRLLWCITELQGIGADEILKNRFGNGDDHRSDLEALSAYVVGLSRGAKMAAPLDHPKEREAYELGKAIFYYRGGTHDFSCATCHSQTGKRIRLQVLPDLTTAAGARDSYTTWPGYRISQGELRTMEWRIGDCFRQQRFPELIYGSPAAVALTTFLARTAQDGAIDAPSLKR